MTDAKKPVLTMPDGSKWERVLICELQQNDNYVVTLRTIGGCTETTYYRPLDPTDSQFIVTACNAHDELVERVAELEAAIRSSKMVYWPDGHSQCVFCGARWETFPDDILGPDNHNSGCVYAQLNPTLEKSHE